MTVSGADETQSKDWISLGRIGAPYGVKGWVKLVSFTEPRENIRDYGHFRAVAGDKVLELELEQVRPHGKTLVAKIAGYDEPEAVRELTGAQLQVNSQELPELDSGEFYWHELTGLTVLTVSGQVLGVVKTLLETGANDVLVVSATEQSIDDQERLIPYLPDQVVKDINLTDRSITVLWEVDWLL